MFLDGITYAAISKNFANGYGSFLHPFYNGIWFVTYTPHPPMLFFFEGLFFKVLGTDFWVEKVFSVFCILITMILMSKLCKKIGLQNGFMSWLFFISIPLIIWAATNNLIENCLMIFTTLSVLLYLHSLERNRFLLLIFAGLSLAIGFLLKGFVAFFPFSFPFIYWLVMKNNTFKRIMLDTFVMTFCAVLPILVIIISSTDVKNYFINYYNFQIAGEMTNVKTVNTRYYILGRYFCELIPCFVICGLLLWKIKFKKEYKYNGKKALMLFLFSLTSVLPIVITMKQSGFYFLPALPFVSIAFAALIDNRINRFYLKISTKQWFASLKYISIILFLTSIITCFVFYGSASRDKGMLSDIDIIAKTIGKNKIISIPDEMAQEYTLSAYCARFYNISIDPNVQHHHQYLLVRKALDKERDNYHKLPLQMELFYLYKAKTNN
jgi:4-amino-4-deoxy-L-arabinose transferase-like glycosyltransferase